MSNQVAIKVQVGKREYKMLVSEDEVQLVQKAAERLNDRLHEFEAKYEVTDMRDLLAMAALYFATEAGKKAPLQELNNHDLAKIDEANHILGKYLASL